MRFKSWPKVIPVAAVLAGTMLVATPTAGADAAQCGPAPTESSLAASRGPFSVTTTDVTGQSGFGGGKIYTPSGHGCTTFGAVALSPGFLSPWAVTAWMGPRLASHGIVVIGIETNSVLDQPAQRGEQLLAALDYLTGPSPVRAARSPRSPPTRSPSTTASPALPKGPTWNWTAKDTSSGCSRAMNRPCR
jgi:hypothetical protein